MSTPSSPTTHEQCSPEKPVRTHSTNELTADDAFSEREDSPTFRTSNALEDLAEDVRKSHLAIQDYANDENNEEHDEEDTDTSISTIDINGSPSDTAVSSERSVEVVTPELPPTSWSSKDSSFGHHSQRSSRSSFPSVVIDLAKPPATQVTVLSTESDDEADSTRPLPSRPSHFDGSSGTSFGTLPIISVSQSLPGRPSATDSKPTARRQVKSETGPSTFEKIMSKTRPKYLPPKQKDEDNRHLADWETMMAHSRAADELKRKSRDELRLARERQIEANTVEWEIRILPDVKAAVQDLKLRRMWWQGVPPKLRGRVWEKVVGNALALSKESYRSCLARARRALDAGSFPMTTLNLIDADIQSTLPSLHIFTLNIGPLYEDLMNILCAWVVSRSDEGLGYVVGASKIAAMFLLNMQPPNAFVSMRNLLERHCMRSFYGGLTSKDDVEAYYRIFDTLLADYMPKMYFNFKQHKILPASYLPEWLVPVFLDHLPLDACSRIWDALMLEGDSFLFRVALAILAFLEPRLFFPEKHELLSVLQGENKAAIEVARRSGSLVGLCKYEIYDLSEDAIWEQLESMESWWKESTWTRLIQRELPDL